MRRFLFLLLAGAALTLVLYLLPPSLWSSRFLGVLFLPANLLTLALGMVFETDVFTDAAGPAAGWILLGSTFLVVVTYCLLAWLLARSSRWVLRRVRPSGSRG